MGYDFLKQLGFNGGIKQFGVCFSDSTQTTAYIVLHTPRSKLANPGQNTSIFIFQIVCFLIGIGPRPVFFVIGSQWGMLRWIGEFRPGNKTIYAVVCVESDKNNKLIDSFINTYCDVFFKNVGSEVVCGCARFVVRARCAPRCAPPCAHPSRNNRLAQPEKVVRPALPNVPARGLTFIIVVVRQVVRKEVCTTWARHCRNNRLAQPEKVVRPALPNVPAWGWWAVSAWHNVFLVVRICFWYIFFLIHHRRCLPWFTLMVTGLGKITNYQK